MYQCVYFSVSFFQFVCLWTSFNLAMCVFQIKCYWLRNYLSLLDVWKTQLWISSFFFHFSHQNTSNIKWLYSWRKSMLIFWQQSTNFMTIWERLHYSGYFYLKVIFCRICVFHPHKSTHDTIISEIKNIFQNVFSGGSMWTFCQTGLSLKGIYCEKEKFETRSEYFSL